MEMTGYNFNMSIALLAVATATATPSVAAVPRANLTVYHVNPLSFGGVPFNMDTGDATGKS